MMNKQEFLSSIEKEKIEEDLIVQLQRETLPLVIWGIGDVAEAVYNYLIDNGITIADVWADGETSETVFHEYQVLNREKLAQKYEKVNVIMGHSWYELGEKITRELPIVNYVFYATRVYYDKVENIKYQEVENIADRYVNLCNNLADKKSEKSVIAYLNTMITGNMQYIFNIYERPGNFYSNTVYTVTSEETLLDIGAYDGDTIRLFLRETDGQYNKIIAVEPDTENFLKLSDFIAQESLKNVILSKCGAWDKKETLQFKAEMDQLSSVNLQKYRNDQMSTIYADRMDYLFKNEPISLIKVNYCDGVVEAIKGCEKIIRKAHPKLAIDVGFDIYKVLELSKYIMALNEKYKIYLRFNRAMPCTFTLYALV